MKSIFKIKKDKIKKEKGSVSVFVLFTVFMFIVILLGIYTIVSTKQKSQIKSDIRIKEIYYDDVNNVDEIYEVQKAIRDGNYNILKNVNSPTLLTGMTPIKFNMPTETTKGTIDTNVNVDLDWYEYGKTHVTRRWANAQTEDGSMWVWIPRYAYKITYYTNENKTTVSNTKTTYGSIDVKFLIGKSDCYYDDEGNMKIAKRCNSEDEVVDTTLDYVVHPAFTDESSINFRNGGWDSELTGIWVAKFEAGYASGNNTAEVKASNVNYSQSNAWVASVERQRNEDGTVKEDGTESARNWLDGIYGETTTSIKYPVFMPLTYTMNYINHNDSYNISRALTDENNIYGLVSTNADSHLMKNSEWGAIAYLAQSVYGQNGTEIKINNVNLNSGDAARTQTSGGSGVESVYAITGCTSNTTNTEENKTTIEEIKNLTGNNPTSKTDELDGGIYAWNQLTGQNASTTGTIYGVYDISGGTCERTSSYVANGNSNLKTYGASIAYENDTLKTTSTKYTTVYPHNSTYDNTTISNTEENLNTASQNNFASNTKMYGDSVRETTLENAGTANSGWNVSSWNSDYSYFPGLCNSWFIRGGYFGVSSSAGSFALESHPGDSYYYSGFRAVLIPTYAENE